MAEISRTLAIAAEPQAIWDVLADFGAVASWAEFVDHSCLLTPAADGIGVGAARRIQLGHNTLVERIVGFDPPHALAYDVEGLPRQIRRLRSSWTLRPVSSGHTGVVLTSSVDIGSNPVQRTMERIFCRVCVKRLDLLMTGLANKLEACHV